MARCPIAPIGLAATAGLNRVDLVWQAGSVPSLAGDGPNPWGPAHHYLVQVTGDGSARLLQTQATGLAVPGLRNGVEYTFEVFGVTDAGRSSGSGSVTATPTTGAEGVVAGLIVEFAPGTTVREGQASVPGEAGVDAVDLTVGEQVSQDAVLVELSEPVSLDDAKTIAADLQADPAVEWAEPDQFLFTASDNAAPAAWNLSGAFGVDAKADPSAGLGATVAVIDTGITSHPALEGRTVSGYDFVSSPEQLMASRQPNAPPVAFDGDYADTGTFGVLGRDANPADPGDWRDVAPTRASSWHGTQMAGVISSIVPGAKIQPVRALSWRGGLLSDIAASITWASGGAVDGAPANENPSKVINMSFAVEAMCPTALQAAIDDARSRGSVLIAAAGNANDDAAKYAPGNCNGVLTVGATNSAGLRADYSNHGQVIDLSAPGGDASEPVSTISNSGTTTPADPGAGSDYGTSIAAAHVSAGAAMLAGATPTITPDDAYRTLTDRDYTKDFANPTCDANPDFSCGAGILSLAQIASVSSGDQDFAMQFNGTSQGAITGSTSAFTSSLTSAVSVAAWVRPEACTSFNMVLDQMSTVSLTCFGNTWRVALAPSWSGGYRDTGITARLNEWQHIAFTRAAGSDAVNFYINGQLAATPSGFGTGGLGTPTRPLTVGFRSDTSNQFFFTGRVDEVRLFNTALTAAQVLASMSTYGPVDQSGLLAYYDFNEGLAGTTGTGTVYNRVSGATSSTNLGTVNGPTYTDIKQTTSSGNNTVVTFPRSYLTAAGGWRVPEGVTSTRALVVGGGGGGGAWVGAGGGGGGVTASSNVSLTPGTPIAVTVGHGGLGAQRTSTLVNGGNGSASTLGAASAVVALGGGVGATNVSQAPGSGSGVATGGGGAYSSGTYAGGAGTVSSGGSSNVDGQPHTTGGGGGAGGNGGSGTGSGSSWASGNGGTGVASDITGVSVFYGGGGGGSAHGTWSTPTSWNSSIVISPGAGGLGGGGAGGRVTTATPTSASVVGQSGTAGLGGGGGGAANFWDNASSYTSLGGSGGSGVVIVSYATAASAACAPEQTQYTSSSTAYRLVAFKATGSCSWAVPAGVTSLDYVVVGGGGGGGGGHGGGGGAGGLKQGTALTVTSGGTLTVTVGEGGAGRSAGVVGVSGGGSSLAGAASVSVSGGGGGGSSGYPGSWNSGSAGGSGGGAAYSAALSATVGAGTSGEGSSGGIGGNAAGASGACYTGGGGGGASASGAASTGCAPGNGGGGQSVSWLAGNVASVLGIGEVLDAGSGTSATYFAGGGGGGAYEGTGYSLATGGSGGGGDGATAANGPGGSGSANTGGGGAGGGSSDTIGRPGGSGGSGVVVLRYATTASTTCAPQSYVSGNYTVLEFQGAASCKWSPPTGVAGIDYLLVGGGGGGGADGGTGGGGGSLRFASGTSIVSDNDGLDIVVGAGGSGGTHTPWVNGSSGGTSSITIGSTTWTAPGGNAGGQGIGSTGGAGGSGGNATASGGSGGTSTSGSGAAGSAGSAGSTSSITGTTITYGGGGGGSVYPSSSTVLGPLAGGTGGGGSGPAGTTSTRTVSPGEGADGLGGGGGGGLAANGVSNADRAAAGGGDGVVLVRYYTTARSLSVSQQPGTYGVRTGWTTVPKVQIVDGNGSAVSLSGVTVTASFSATSGSATVSGNTAVTDSSGIATFSSLAVNGAPGTTGTLSFSADLLTSVTSNAFSVTGVTLTLPSTAGITTGSATSLGVGASALTGFAAADTVLVTLSTTAGSLSVTSSTGLSTVTGYQSPVTAAASSIAFTGTQANVNTALQTLRLNATGSLATVSGSAVLAGAAYNPTNGRYYEVITPGSNIGWVAARAAAALRTFNGLTGYLATVTSSSENSFLEGKLTSDGWIGASDTDSEGTWKWMTGPESGTTFWNGAAGGSAPAGQYANWTSGEPNNSSHAGCSDGEDYGQFYRVTAKWNDLPCVSSSAGLLSSYIVEYGGLSGETAYAQSTSSTAVTIANVPGAPTGVTATAGQLSATVSWTAPSSDGGSAITGYTVTSSPGSFTCSPSPATATSCTVTGLTAGTAYTFTVVATNAVGSSSSSTASSSVTPFGAVTQFSVTMTGGSTALSAASKTAGTPFSVRVTAQDSGGRTNTTYTGALTLSSTAFSGSVLATIATNGYVDSTALTPTVAGSSRTVTVTDGSVTTANASGNFTVNPGPASISTSQVTAATSPIAINGGTSVITVTLKDAYGNALTSGGSTVTVASTLGTVGTVTDGGNGSYTATLTSGTVSGAATVTATAGGVTLLDDASVVINSGSATQVLITTQPVAGVSGSALGTQPVVRIADTYGNTVTTSSATVTVTASGGTVGGAEATAGVAASSGVATFSNLTFAGLVSTSYSLTFASSGLTSVTSNSITPTGAGAASSLRISGSGSQTAGVEQNLTITAFDSGGNVATGYSGTKSLTFSGASASPLSEEPTVSDRTGINVPFGTATDIDFVSGVATTAAGTNGGMALYKAEAATVSVTDGSASSTLGNRLSVTVTAGAASRLVISTQPRSWVSGSVMYQQPVVGIRDSWGNPVSSTATVTVSTSGGTLGGSQASSGVAAVAGTATFTDLTFAGLISTAYVFTFESSGLTSDMSGNVSLSTAGPAAVITADAGAGQSATVGTAVATRPRVLVTDTGGNPIAGVSVTFAVASGGGALGASGSVTTNASGLATSPAWTLGTTSGANTVTATSGSLTGSPVTFTATGTPDAATRLVITGSTTATAGAFQNITITAQDAFGNTDTTYSGEKSITFSGAASSLDGWDPFVVDKDGGVKYFGTATPLTFTNGVASVSAMRNGEMTLYKAESATISVTDGTLASTGSDRLSVTVSPDTAWQVAMVTEPGVSASGSLLFRQPVVQVRDAYGNVVSWTGTVSASVSPYSVQSGGTLGGSEASSGVTAVAGTATFTDLTFAGTISSGYQLAFTTSSGVTGLSGGFGPSHPGLAAKVLVSAQPVAGASGSVLSTQPVVRITDSADNVVTSSSATVTVTASGGALSGVQASTGVAASYGVATFTNLAFAGSTSSSYTLTFASTGLTSATSAAITPSGPGSASKLVITGSATQVAGATQDVTITAQDAYGNTVTGYSGTKSITFSGGSQAPDGQVASVIDKDGATVAFGTATSLTFTSGVTTVSSSRNGVMALYKMETATISVTDGTISSTGSDTLSVTVSVGTASKLAVGTQPAAGASGAALGTQPVVRVVDAYGNLTASTATVTVTASGGTLGGTQATSGKVAVSGAATFTNLTFAGLMTSSYTLTFASTGLTSVTSSAITPTGAGAAATIAVNAGNNQTATAGSAVSTAPSVLVTDAAGNPVASRSVTFAVATGGGSGTSLTATSNSSGIATVGSWTLGTTAGANTMTATASGLTGSPVTFTATGVAGVVTRFAVTMSGSDTYLWTSPQVAGTPFSVRVSAQDANYNVNSDWTGTVALTSGGFSGTVNAVITANGYVDGISITPTVSAQRQVIAASSGAISTASASSAYTVRAGPLAGFTVKEVTRITYGYSTGFDITNKTAGAGFFVQVTAVDAYGNAKANINGANVDTTTAFTGSVTLSSSAGILDGAATCSAFQSSDGWCIKAIAVGTAGSATVTATEVGGGGNTGASNSFTVSAGPAAKTTITAQPSGGASGSQLASQVSARIEDGNGNTVATASGSASQVIPAGSSWSAAANGTSSSNIGNIVYGRDASGNPLWVANTGYGVARSTDGTSWTTGSVYAGARPVLISYGLLNGTTPFWVAYGQSSTCYTSYDAVTWSIGPCHYYSNVTEDAAYGGGTWISVGSAGIYEGDIGNRSIQGGDYNAVAYGAGLFVATQPTGSVISWSRTGTSWTNVTTGTVSNATDIAYGNGLWVITSTSGGVYTSTDGRSWTARSTGASTALNTVTYGGGTWVAAGASGRVATSYDGITWTSSTALASAAWTSSASDGTRILIAQTPYNSSAMTSTIMTSTTSTTGISGTSTASPSAGSLAFSGTAFSGTVGTTYRLGVVGTATSLGGVTTNGFTLTGAGTATQLGLSTSAAGFTVGSAFTTQPAVTIRDSSGNTVTSDSTSVITATVSAGASLVGTTTATAVNGVATFTDLGILGTAGTAYTVTFSSGSLTSATQSITPTPGAATALAITRASVGTASGATFTTQPKIAVTDAYGNTVTSYAASTVTATVSSGGTLRGTTTATTSSGVATFSNLGITGTAGTTYTITYSLGAFTPVTASVTVTVGAATTIAVNAGNNQTATVNTAVATAPSVIVTDSGGNPVSGTSVSFSGDGTRNPTSSVATNASGIAALTSWTLGTTAGTNTLTATATGLIGSPVTITATGVAGTVTKFGVTMTGGATALSAVAKQAGVPFDVRVSAQDAHGNTNSSWTGTVTLTSAAFVGSVDVVITSNGYVDAVSLTPTVLGSTARVAAASGAITTSTASSTFTVNPGPVASFTVTDATGGAITSQTAGTPFTVKITALDQFGNTATGFTSTATLTATGTVVTNGATTGVTAAFVAGVLSPSVQLRSAGTQVLTATQTTGGSATGSSGSFTVSPGRATGVAISNQPAGMSSGATISPQPTGRIIDDFGNTVTSSSDSVTLAKAGGSSWSTPAGIDGAMSEVAHGNGKYVGFTQFGFPRSSTDGSTWNSGTKTYSMDPRKAAFGRDASGNPLWLAVGRRTSSQLGLIRSSNGETWTESTALGHEYWVDIAYGNGAWVAVSNDSGSGTIRTSFDGGLTWPETKLTSATFVEYGGGRWFAGSSSAVWTSVDAITWTAVSLPSGCAGTGAYGNGTWVMTSTSLCTSTDGVTWTDLGASPAGTITDITYGGGMWIAGGSGGRLVTSYDASAWTVVSAATTGFNSSASLQVAAGGGSAVAVSNYGSSPYAVRTTTSSTGLSGTTTINASNGLLDFSAARLSGTVGSSHRLVLTSSTLQSVSTSEVTITGAGSASALSLTRSSVGTASGAAFTTQPQVSIMDAGGNVITSDNSTVVTASVSSGATLVGTTTATVVNGVATFTDLGISGTASTAYTVTYSSGSVTSATQSVTVTTGAAASLSIVRASVGTASGAAFSTQPQVSVKDSGGNTVSSYSGTVTVTVSAGGTLVGTTTQATSSGTATFQNLGITGTAGTSYTITYSLGSLTAATASVTVTAGAATTIAVNAGNGQSATAGSDVATAPSVLVTDSGGNAVAGTAVTFTVASGGGTRLPTTTVSTNASGIAAVTSWTLGPTVGTNTLTATAAGLSGSPVTFTATGTVGAPAQLVRTTAAVGTAAGAAFTTQPVISITDANGNVVTTDSSSVIAATVSTGGSLIGTTTATAVNGVATFSDLGISGTSGSTYTVTFSTGSLTTSPQSITVTTGAASQLVITTAASGATYGNAWTSQPVIELRDSGDNVVTTDSSSVVTVSVSTGGTLAGPATATASSGVATFAGLSLTGVPANYTLTFASGALSSTQSLALSQVTQTVTFGGLAGRTYGDGPFSLSATASSGLVVTFVSADDSICAVSGTVVTITGAGSCSITASQAGNTFYSAAPPVAQAFTIAQATQASLVVTSPTSMLFGESHVVTAAGGSGSGTLAFLPASSDFPGTAGCSITTGTGALTYASVGTCTVRAHRAGDANHTATTSSDVQITIDQAGQTLAFTTSVPSSPLPGGTYTPAVATLSTVTGLSSGVTPSLTASGACTMAGGVVTFTVTGTCTVTATAASNTNYTAATPVAQVISVGSLNQNITFAQPESVEFGSAGFSAGATASSGLAVTYMLGAGTTNSACTVTSLGAVTVNAVGTCEIVASQSGDAQYAAASDVARAFQVVAALPTAPTLTSASASSQAITVGFTAPGFTGGAPITAYRLVATPTSGGAPVSTTACTASPCTISGLANGTEYTVTVAAINTAGTGSASSASTALTPATAAYAVGALAATPGDTFVDLTWTPLTVAQLGGGAFTRYEISRRIAGSSSWTLETDALTTRTTASHRITGLDNGTSYDFKVVAITTANGSAIDGNTAEVVQYPSTVPSAPRNAGVLALSPTSVHFSWVAPLRDGGSALISPFYVVTVTGSTGATPVTCVPAGTDRHCIVSGLTNDATYTFSVVARNRMGDSVAATQTYAVPSADATLSALEVTGSVGAVALSPAFAAATTEYTALVDNTVSSVTVTPTTTSAGATVTVDGVTVVSGDASDAIELPVGETTIDVEVTASDPAFTEQYTITLTRAAPLGGGRASGERLSPNLEVRTPPSVVSSGAQVGAVLLDGEAETTVLTPNATNSGWELANSDFAVSVSTRNADGTPEPMSSGGVMQVPQGGSVQMRGDGYLPGSTLNVFFVPFTAPRSGVMTSVRIVERAAEGSIYLGSVTAKATGAIDLTITIPRVLARGDYILQINGQNADALVRSVNLRVSVLAGPIAESAAVSKTERMRRAGFFKGGTSVFAEVGVAKMREIVSSIPRQATNVRVEVVGVSTAMGDARANIALAADRAQRIVDYLQTRGVNGAYTVNIATSFVVGDAMPANAGGDERSELRTGPGSPMSTDAGKPLTTVTVSYDLPGAPGGVST